MNFRSSDWRILQETQFWETRFPDLFCENR